MAERELPNPVAVPVVHKEVKVEPEVNFQHGKQQQQLVVTVRLSPSPNVFHLLEVRMEGREATCIQIRGDCDRRVVATIAAAIAGLGVI